MANRVERIEELFLTALELSEVERPRFLAAQCDGDGELRDEVDQLLRLDGAEDGLSRMDEKDGSKPSWKRGDGLRMVAEPTYNVTVDGGNA